MESLRPAPFRRVYLPEDLDLRAATRADDAFLYRLLVERYRTPRTNIVGMALEELPSFEQHVAHLDREPYPRLEIVEVDGCGAGLMYLSRSNALGCFVLQDYVARGLGLAACYRFLQRGPYPIVAHVNALNRAAWRSAERLGFARTEEQPGRLTFELHGAPLDPFQGLRRARAGR
jgi:RimJ/RimL family protein N-acetyltransferase